MTKSQLKPEEWDSVHKEIMDWKQEIDDTDNILNKNRNTIDSSSNFYPEVRRPVEKSENETNETETQKEKKVTAATDYNEWDKFDADKECLKLDLEEEKREEEKQRRELAEKKKQEMESNMSLEEKEIELIAETADSLSLEERKVMAVKEKELGNEFYKRNLFNEALKHYTRSIYLHPSAVGYNNRAATYLKQCKFTKAQNDLDIVLDMEPDNVKGHFRRALTRQHKNEFHKALDDILFVLKHEPNHMIAKHIANELRENCCKLPKVHKLRTYDENDPKKVIYTEVSDEEFQKKYKDKKEYLEVNNHNLPKVMCNCTGKHTNNPLLSSNDPLRYQHIRARYGERANDKIAEMERANKMLKAAGSSKASTSGKSFNEPAFKSRPVVPLQTDTSENVPSTAGARRLDIVELEKIEEEDNASKTEGTNLNVIVDNKSEPPSSPKVITSCLVKDNRRVKRNSQSKVYFGNYEEQEEDSEDGKQEEAAALVPNMEGSEQGPKTKQEKMNQNIHLKEALDMGGGGDAATMESEMSVVDNNPPVNTNISSMPVIAACEPTSPAGTSLNSSSIMLNGNVTYESSSSELDEDLPNEITVDIHQVEVVPHSNIESLMKYLFPNEPLKKCDCGNGYVIWPSQFESKWVLLERSPNSLEERSKLIRLVCPHRLSAVISNTLNEELLSGFIECLHQHFDPVTEGEKVKSYLMSIANLQRFKIIYCFLSKSSKCSVNTLLKRLCPISPELDKAFS